jgi:hypothetical protein
MIATPPGLVVPTAQQWVVFRQNTPLRVLIPPGTVSVVHVLPASSDVRITGLFGVDDVYPTAQQSSVLGQETPSISATTGGSCEVHTRPPSVVVRRTSSPTATQLVALEHDTSLRDGSPGADSAVQTAPPSEVYSTSLLPKGAEPTTTHTFVVGHDAASGFPTEPPCTTFHTDPASVVFSVGPPTTQQIKLDGHETPRKPASSDELTSLEVHCVPPFLVILTNLVSVVAMHSSEVGQAMPVIEFAACTLCGAHAPPESVVATTAPDSTTSVPPAQQSSTFAHVTASKATGPLGNPLVVQLLPKSVVVASTAGGPSGSPMAKQSVPAEQVTATK